MAANKTRRKKTADAPRDAVEVALGLFEARGYAAVALADIAESAGLSLAALLRQHPGKSALIATWLGRIDAGMLDAAKTAEDETPRDRLFEVIMARLDLLAPRKPLIRALGRSALCDPDLACTLALALRRSLRWMLAAARIETEGLRGFVVRRGLSAIYADTIRVWLADPSEDAARTMAHLDKRLRQAAGLLGRLPRRGGTTAETVTDTH
ncbi:TetR family transcriptional regulator [Desertibaculum subflavum]|uniref:TetR family transcriptional regulator n=1 Tax=Desertibaculum subflavum TaxID=2268458 RepID=UPI000E67599C